MLEICHRKQKNLHVMRHWRTDQCSGDGGSEEWFPMGDLQTAQLFSERSNLLRVLPCLSSRSIGFPGQRGTNHVVWQLEVNDRRWDEGNSWALTNHLSMTWEQCPSLCLSSVSSLTKNTQSHRKWAPNEATVWGLAESQHTGNAPLPCNSLENGRAVVWGKTFLTGRALERKKEVQEPN